MEENELSSMMPKTETEIVDFLSIYQLYFMLNTLVLKYNLHTLECLRFKSVRRILTTTPIKIQKTSVIPESPLWVFLVNLLCNLGNH